MVEARKESETHSENILVYLAYPTWRKNALVALARAKELQESGHEVVVMHCAATAGTCAVNSVGNPATCQACQNAVRKNTTRLGLPLVALTPKPDPDSAEVSFHERKILLEGVMSGLISAFRMMPDDIRSSRMISAIKRRYLRTSQGLLAALKSKLSTGAFDRIEVFNGRHACSRLCLIAAESLGIPFNTLEVTACGKPTVFQGHRPHDRKHIQKRILSYPADLETASAFYERRRSPKDNKYAKKHSRSFAPPATEGFTRKVSVFLSSQDEFESLGKDWVSPFADYAAVIRKISDQNPDTLFCVRFHPNQGDIATDVVTPFEDVEQRKNVMVYYPDVSLDSYQMIDWSDLVITFGSTISIESCWMGKPSIILGPSYYDGLDVSYVPTSVEELDQCIKADLPPKSRDNAARFAVYAQRDGDDFEYLLYDGKNLQPNGFRHRGLIATRVARAVDNLTCHTIKSLATRRRSA
ncbi:Capsule polysaccharide biosynthesis protein [Neorhodopirellula lusitana]|uniref:Capsule polysaccharide biosynthesis protein n=2 Tax=Neorhodopirellula lusitana TaxID=445327 RepID=A0ABY1PXJ1_9BACT|nr:Capsule polysaccharide biosynthesis protein [Neorhodopirellula lusitana]